MDALEKTLVRNLWHCQKTKALSQMMNFVHKLLLYRFESFYGKELREDLMKKNSAPIPVLVR